jgi:hypothetical protein
MAVALAIPDFPKSTFEMQGAAGLIANDDLCLQSPVCVGLGGGDQRA